MKKSKIIISSLLIVILAALACCCIACQDKNKEEEKKEFVLGIISDPQIVAASEVGDDDYESFQDFNAIGQKMLFISEAILKTAVDRLIEKKVNAVLIPGDLTENGSKAGHEMVASQCARLEAAGIPTYVICGNHDINKAPKRYLKKADAVAQGLTIYEEFSDGSCSVRVPGVSPEDFMTIFNEFGYKDAVALDRLDTSVRVSVPVEGEIDPYEYDEIGTMSYVQDLSGSDLRLISIDASNYYEDENEDTYYMTYYGTSVNRKTAIKGTGYSVMTYRLLDWIEEQLKAARDAGKKPIVMAHFPVNNQMGEVVGQITDGVDNRMNMTEELLDLFAEYKVEYVFTGHLHTQHIATYTDNYFKTVVTDVETGCLTNYPLPMRYFKIKDGNVTIENEYINAVKEEYLPAYVNSESVREAALNGLQHYSLDPFIYDNLLHNFDERINSDGQYSLFYKIFDMLELDPDGQHEEELASLADYLYNDLYMAFMKMPLYAKDKKATDKHSLEEICRKYNVTLPASDYTSVFQFFIQVLGKFYKYDYENDGGPITYESTEGTILRYGIYSAFEVIRSSELFSRLHSINEDIAETVVTENFVSKLYKDGTLDLLCDDFFFNVASIIKPVLKNTPITLDNLKANNVVSITQTLLLPMGMSMINSFLGGPYNEEENTLYGVSVDTLIGVGNKEVDGEKVPVLELYLNNILRDIVFDKIGDGVLR